MTPTAILREHLRAFISERIPAGKTDADTLFTDAQLDLWMIEPSDSLEEAAWRGWLIKAGEDRDGVLERSIGSERFKFTDPNVDRKFALEMADYYYSLIPGGGDGSQLGEFDPPDVLGTRRISGWDHSRLLGYVSEQ